mmetsp:Transcript_8773/g.11648  ORF Transcript_8773/g.11648 Transcript_8773/m.11648 type:complete len:234 (-) Transcript_8773:179-880(-)
MKKGFLLFLFRHGSYLACFFTLASLFLLKLSVCQAKFIVLPINSATLHTFDHGFVRQEQIGYFVSFGQNCIAKILIWTKDELQCKTFAICIIDTHNILQRFQTIDILFRNYFASCFVIGHARDPKMRNTGQHLFIAAAWYIHSRRFRNRIILFSTNNRPSLVVHWFHHVRKFVFQCGSFYHVLLHYGIATCGDILQFFYSFHHITRQMQHGVVIIFVIIVAIVAQIFRTILRR